MNKYASRHKVGRGRRVTTSDLSPNIPAQAQPEFEKLASLLVSKEAAFHLLQMGQLARYVHFTPSNRKERDQIRDQRIRVFISAHLSLETTKAGLLRRRWKTILDDLAVFGVDWNAIDLANRLKLNREAFNDLVLQELTLMVTELERTA